MRAPAQAPGLELALELDRGKSRGLRYLPMYMLTNKLAPAPALDLGKLRGLPYANICMLMNYLAPDPVMAPALALGMLKRETSVLSTC